MHDLANQIAAVLMLTFGNVGNDRLLYQQLRVVRHFGQQDWSIVHLVGA